MKILNSLSLCSGIGGLELAGEAFGIKPLAFCDNDKFACKVLNKQWPNVPVFPDIIQLDKLIKNKNKELKNYGIFEENIDIISAGWPCQSFSYAGKKRGREDKRGLIFDNVLSIARNLRVPCIIGENVTGAIKNSGGLEFWQRELEKSGYFVSSFVFSAKSQGLAHKRERVFIIATNFNYINAHRVRWDATNSELFPRFISKAQAQPSFLSKSNVPRRNYGVPTGLDARRLKAVGNAVSPLQAKPIFKSVRLVFDTYLENQSANVSLQRIQQAA